LIPIDNGMCEILPEKVYETRITADLQLSTTPLTNGCLNDDMTKIGPLRSQSLFQFIQISDAYFYYSELLYTFCCNSPHPL